MKIKFKLLFMLAIAVTFITIAPIIKIGAISDGFILTTEAASASSYTWANEWDNVSDGTYFKVNYNYELGRSYIQYVHDGSEQPNLPTADVKGVLLATDHGNGKYYNMAVDGYDICSYNPLYGEPVGVVKAYGNGSEGNPYYFYPIYDNGFGHYYAIFDGGKVDYQTVKGDSNGKGDIIIANTKVYESSSSSNSVLINSSQRIGYKQAFDSFVLTAGSAADSSYTWEKDDTAVSDGTYFGLDYYYKLGRPYIQYAHNGSEQPYRPSPLSGIDGNLVATDHGSGKYYNMAIDGWDICTYDPSYGKPVGVVKAYGDGSESNPYYFYPIYDDGLGHCYAVFDGGKVDYQTVKCNSDGKGDIIIANTKVYESSSSSNSVLINSSQRIDYMQTFDSFVLRAEAATDSSYTWADDWIAVSDGTYFGVDYNYELGKSYIQYVHDGSEQPNLPMTDVKGTLVATDHGSGKDYNMSIDGYDICPYDPSYGEPVGVVKAYGDGSESNPYYFYPIYDNGLGYYYAVFDGGKVDYQTVKGDSDGRGDIIIANTRIYESSTSSNSVLISSSQYIDYKQSFESFVLTTEVADSSYTWEEEDAAVSDGTYFGVNYYYKLGRPYVQYDHDGSEQPYRPSPLSGIDGNLVATDHGSGKYYNMAIDGWDICPYNPSYGEPVGVVKAYGDGSEGNPYYFYPIYDDGLGHYYTVFDGGKVDYQTVKGDSGGRGDIIIKNTKIYESSTSSNSVTFETSRRISYMQSYDKSNGWDLEDEIYASETSFTYDVRPHNPTINGRYQLVRGSDIATGSGSYTATISGMYDYYGVKTFTWTISPKTVENPTIELSQNTFTYDGTAKQPTVTLKDGSTTISEKEYDVSYSDNTDAGMATVTITDMSGGNYTVSGRTTFIVNKEEPTVTAPTANEFEYDGTEHELINAGSTTGGTMQYSIDGENYAENIPKSINAGTYTVYYKVAGGKNYKDTEAETISVTITKKKSAENVKSLDTKAGCYYTYGTNSDVDEDKLYIIYVIDKEDLDKDYITIANSENQEMLKEDERITYVYKKIQFPDGSLLDVDTFDNGTNKDKYFVAIRISDSDRTKVPDAGNFNFVLAYDSE